MTVTGELKLNSIDTAPNIGIELKLLGKDWCLDSIPKFSIDPTEICWITFLGDEKLDIKD